jgi:formamidopyrimidine-DNA glycosylase
MVTFIYFLWYRIDMPELPEVHTTATVLNSLLKNLTIKDVWTNYRSVYHVGKHNIKDASYLQKFKETSVNKKIVRVRRRAKNVLIDLEKDITILVHMKMTGHLLYGTYERSAEKRNDLPKEWEQEEWKPIKTAALPLKDPFNRFIRLVFTFSNNTHLVLSDMRRFAKVIYFETHNHPEDLLGLGPEPLEPEFDFNRFKERLGKRPTGKIKQVLMDQTLIAGIGNIYSDEMLWKSGVHPEERVCDISSANLKTMFFSMKEVLQKGIDFRGDSTSDYRTPSGEAGNFQYHHRAYRQTGKPCSKRGCKGTIMRLKIGGRSAHYCSLHQQRSIHK